MNQRFGLIREQTFRKKLFFLLATFIEGQLGGGFDGIDGSKRCEQPTLLFASYLASPRRNRSILLWRT